MKKSTLQYIVVFFFLYLIGELYWLNDGVNFEVGQIMNFALLTVLGCNLIYQEWVAFQMSKEQRKSVGNPEDDNNA